MTQLTLNFIQMFTQHSTELSQNLLDAIAQQGGRLLYETYLKGKIPQHLSKNHIAQLSTICKSELIDTQNYNSLYNDLQAKGIERDSFGSVMIRSEKGFKAGNLQRPSASALDKKRITRFSTRATSAIRSMSSTFTKTKSTIPQVNTLVKLPIQVLEDPEQAKVDQTLRKQKKEQEERVRIAAKQLEREEKQKEQQTAKAEVQFKYLLEKKARTTYGFDGGILAIQTHLPLSRVVQMDINLSTKTNSHLPTKSKKPLSRRGEKVSEILCSEYSQAQNKDIFTSLVYEMHSTKGSTKNQSKFQKNDEYNNNNRRQSSHVNVINLVEGTYLAEPLNAIATKNPRKDQLLTLQNRTATFKHFLLQKFEDDGRDSLDAEEQHKLEDVTPLSRFERKSLGETRTNWENSRSRSNPRKSVCNNVFETFYRPLTVEAGNNRKRVVNRPLTSHNNGKERMTVQGDIDVLIL